MRRRQRILNPHDIILNPGTRVVLQQRFDDENGFLKTGTMGQVKRFCEDQIVEVETPAGRIFRVPRDHLVVQKQRVLARAAARQQGWDDYKDRIIFASVVGSHAWGLSGPGSDQDIKGVFVLPFEDHSGFYKVVEEIQDPRGDGQYWEIGKLIHQALNADPNTLEALWSPLLVALTPLGEKLLERRRMFVSNAIVGSFGRYALSQFKKIDHRLKQGDPGKIARPKNAYNLLRLLYSALRWIREGQPLMTVEGEIRSELMAIKQSQVPIEDVLKRGFDLAAEVEEAHGKNSCLPDEPDFDAAHDLLIEMRRAAADKRQACFTSLPTVPAPILNYPELTEWDFAKPQSPKLSQLRMVIFDLDDTLFDCYSQCVLAAHKEAAEAMVKAGLKADPGEVAEARLAFRGKHPDARLEDMVCSALGFEAHEDIARAGETAFFQRDPGALTPFPETVPILNLLKEKGLKLGLVSRGDEKTQQRKIDSLKLRAYFDSISIVPLGSPKSVALKELSDEFSANEVLVVGDNIRDEIRDARQLGMPHCWLSRGEFKSAPLFRVWTIHALSELQEWLNGDWE
ncbi:MAG: HAD-IA family hydrolase [Planctomycetota bacterium]|nr:HAD-IA family hydrolase [Planctomycetota bacterium]